MPISKSAVYIILLFLLGSAASAQDKPNVVYILVDNWGWGDISLQGGTVPTPRIDELANQGARFTNFNVQNQCTPTGIGGDSRSNGCLSRPVSIRHENQVILS